MYKMSGYWTTSEIKALLSILSGGLHYYANDYPWEKHNNFSPAIANKSCLPSFNLRETSNLTSQRHLTCLHGHTMDSGQWCERRKLSTAGNVNQLCVNAVPVLPPLSLPLNQLWETEVMFLEVNEMLFSLQSHLLS